MSDTEGVLPLPSWPEGAEVAVSFTFDVDAEAGWLGEGSQYERRLTTLSAGRYGVVRGLPRILQLLSEFDVPATFYVPGVTAQRHAAALAAVVDAGHEVGHHGHLHLRSDRASADDQRREIEQGMQALGSYLGIRPRGYRSASWELTPETFELLLEYEFAFDSSCMGDDRPYLERYNGRALLELPPHWSLDDWPYFEWTIDTGGNLADPATFLRVWLDEFESAVCERRHVTYTMHPEVIGRGYRIAILRQLIEAISGRANVWFATHGSVANRVASVMRGQE